MDRTLSAARRYELLAAHARDLILFVRRSDGRILEANAAAERAYGYGREELLSLAIQALRAPGTRQLTAEQMAQADAVGIRFETVHRRKDGGTFPVEVSSQGATLDGERVLVSVVRDITARRRAEEDRRRAEEALREADRRKDEFLAMLSHELRNPLASLRSASSLLERVAPGTDADLRARRIIDRQLTHLTRMVDDLLDVSRITRGKVQLQPERLDLVEVVRRALEDQAALFEAAGIELSTRLPELPLWVDGDATRLSQVLGNLLQNAAKFTARGGHVAVALTREPHGVALVRVTDDGVGIAPALLQRIFEPFAQADDGLHRGRGGLGLGLSLVKSFVELHGGSVEARSEGTGRGAELAVRLPAAPEPPALRGPPRRAEMPRRRVLVVEDNADAADTLREVLLTWQHEVELASDGREALEKARAFAPDVVLCDIGLPEMDGYQVARAVRADPALRSTFLVAVTGYAMPEDQRRALEAGFDRHLGKPVAIDAIAALLAAGRDAPPGS